MKYLDGGWLIREGYSVQYAAHVFSSRIEEGPFGWQLCLYQPFRFVSHAGMTLDGGLLTVEISSPRRGIIGVRQYHHLGQITDRPAFDLNYVDTNVEIEETDEHFRFVSGEARLEVSKGPELRYRFYHDENGIESSKPKTRLLERSQAYVTDDKGNPWISTRLALNVGEQIYGLGERFSPFVKNGQAIDMWNRDGGTGTIQAYKNIPFYLSSENYGIFVNHTGAVEFEVASEKVSDVQIAAPGEELAFFFIPGKSPKEVLSQYGALTGRPPQVPEWSYGLWLSTSFLTNYDEETVMHFIDGMEERGLPLEVFHFDCLWMEPYEWCGFKWDPIKFPDPAALLRKIKDKGLKVCVWINPYIGQKSPLFRIGMEKGYFLKRSDGTVWQWDKWQAGMAIVDFTNPEAVSWYQGFLHELLDMGVDCFKTDFGERIPTDCVYHDGSDPQLMHNYYTLLYNAAVFEVLEKKRGEGDAVLFARSATTGGQMFPVHWGGDCTADYESMAESLRSGLSIGLSGFGYWSHDIGGFEAGCTPDIYKRWTQFGLLSSHSRYHGSSEYKVPWLYGDEACDVTRRFTMLKLRLMPYLKIAQQQVTKESTPMMRAMLLDFPEDPTCLNLDRQYMLGDDLLVAPVFGDDGVVRFYLPEGGVWVNLLDGEKLEGGHWYTRRYDYMNLPLFLRPGSALPVASKRLRAVFEEDETVVWYCNPSIDGDSANSILRNTEKDSIDVTQAGFDGFDPLS